MDELTSTINSMCKTIRATGLPKEQCHHLLNTFRKWISNNGVEWFVARMKDYHLWYETYLAGEPKVPDWFAHTHDDLPKGVMHDVFKMRNPQKVLAILSVHTVVKSRQLLPKQKEKFEKGLRGNSESSRRIPDKEMNPKHLSLVQHFKADLHQGVPGYQILTGSTIPVGRMTHHCDRSSRKLGQHGLAEMYTDSWRYLPNPTVEYLLYSGQIDHLPSIFQGLSLDLLEMRKKARSDFRSDGDFSHPKDLLRYLSDNRDVLHSLSTRLDKDVREALNARCCYDPWIGEGDVVGRIGLIQEVSLKLRTIANPNRISQYYTYPLGELWYSQLKKLPTDCTFDQKAGALWVQDQLRQGVHLTGSDLSSATDLLSLDQCLALLSKADNSSWHREFDQLFLDYGKVVGLPFPSEQSFKDFDHPIQDRQVLKKIAYELSVNHFYGLSRGNWLLKEDKDAPSRLVRWEQGQPLGVYPSFALLGLTNNLVASWAINDFLNENSLPKGVRKEDFLSSYRVIGDDIIMRSEVAPYYEKRIKELGAEVNTSKSLSSSKIGELAGQVITPVRINSKRIKPLDQMDDTFLKVANALGPQATGIMTSRQRKAYQAFKYAPAIAYGDHLSEDSHGEKLSTRIAWWESITPPAEPIQEKEFQSLQEFVNDIILNSQSESVQDARGARAFSSSKKAQALVPLKLQKACLTLDPNTLMSIQDIIFDSTTVHRSGDPRKWFLPQGTSMLRYFESVMKSPRYIPYELFKSSYEDVQQRADHEIKSAVVATPQPDAKSVKEEAEFSAPTLNKQGKAAQLSEIELKKRIISQARSQRSCDRSNGGDSNPPVKRRRR